jgi:hypothetical protein
MGGRGRRIAVQGKPQAKHEILSEKKKNLKTKGLGV